MKKKCLHCLGIFLVKGRCLCCSPECSKAYKRTISRKRMNLLRSERKTNNKKSKEQPNGGTAFTPSSIPHNQEVLPGTGATDNSLEVMKLQLESKKLDVEAKKIDLEMNLLELKKLDVESGKMEMKQSNTQDQLNALNILNGVSSGRVFISNGVKLVPDWY